MAVQDAKQDCLLRKHLQADCNNECATGGECPFAKTVRIDRVLTTRPSKTRYYLDIAKAVAARSTCLRHKYGAIIVKDDEILATGYNGSPRGTPNCCDLGYCQRSELGGKYETCVAVHAEQNALISAARRDMIGGQIYIAEADSLLPAIPCAICARMIKNAGLETITL